MNTISRPDRCPANPCFSSGPCAKRPGWSLAALEDACLARSHRSGPAKAKLASVIEQSKSMLGMPDDYLLGIVPASDTGAVEMALWSLLGERGVDVLAWESFGAGWAGDISKDLKIDDVRLFKAEYGQLPNLTDVDCNRDVVFTWNGTTSGVRVPNGDWIPADREGLTICDATSAAFAMDLPWDKLDVVTYSWQKVLGGEAQHGMLALSPRAVARLESFTPPWPVPKVFRLTKAGKLIAGIFRGETINTPSMLAVEDALDGLSWAQSVGGLKGLIKRSEENAAVLYDWIDQSDWVGNLADVAEQRSTTSVCLKIVDPWFQDLSDDDQAAVSKRVAAALDKEGVAFDIGAYRDAPPGLRIWAGATVEKDDLEALCPWLDWAYATVKAEG